MCYSIEIINKTEHTIKGEISHMKLFSPVHYFFMKPNSSWKLDKKKVWPLLRVSATVRTSQGIFKAKPLMSIICRHTIFEVICTGRNSFMVIRLNQSEDS